jgi:hypothetical protein
MIDSRETLSALIGENRRFCDKKRKPLKKEKKKKENRERERERKNMETYGNKEMAGKKNLESFCNARDNYRYESYLDGKIMMGLSLMGFSKIA